MIQVFLQISMVMVAYFTATFAVGFYRKNYNIVDMAWGSGFGIVALIALFSTNLFLARQLLTTALAIIWGIRICFYIGIRNWGKSTDPRLARLQQSWGSWEPLYSYLIIFLSQAILVMIIGYPLVLVNTSTTPGLNILDYIAVTVWIAGFICETVADIQIYKFLHNPQNHGRIMRSGLWYYSRHPNYFGESLMWCGIFLIALSVPYGWTAIISPFTITFLLLYVSGIPPAEKMLESNPEFQDYKRTTSAFIPWFPKE